MISKPHSMNKSIKLLNHQFVRFLLVGGLNTIFGYSVYALFTFMNFNYSVAIMLATIAGIIFNFKTIGRIVFKNHNNRLIFKFLGVYVVYYLLNLTGITLLNKYVPNKYISQVILVLPLAGVSFYLNKKYVFQVGNLSVKVTRD